MKKVKDFMGKDIKVINHNETMDNILKVFALTHHNFLPVVDDAGKILGGVSLEELLEDLLFSREEVTMLEKMTLFTDFLSDVSANLHFISTLIIAKDIMYATFYHINEDAPMIEAAVLMKKKNIRSLIVLNDENVPVGYISRNEICKAFLL